VKNALGHEIPDPNPTRREQLRQAEGQQSIFSPAEVEALRAYAIAQLKAGRA
jgi:hypothetical protein